MHQSDQKPEDDQIDERLRIAQRRFSSLLRSLPIGIAIIRSDGTIEAVNAAIVDLFGHEEGYLLGRNIDTLLRNPPWARRAGPGAKETGPGAKETGPGAKETGPGAKETGSLRDWHTANIGRIVELSGWTRDLEVVPIDFGLMPLDTDSRERLVVSIQDVTERYLANKLKQEFYQMLSHDLRSPLTNVALFLQLLEKRSECGTLTEMGGQRLAAAEENIERILSLVDGLLEIDRLESSVDLAVEPLAAGELIGTSVASVFEAASAKDIVIKTAIDQVVFEGNFGLLQRVVVNLLTNAIGHSPRGKSIELSARLDSEEAIGPVFRLEIRDHGAGVPEEEKPLIFEKFKQGSQRKTGGYGLGLAICRQIVLQHHGAIGCHDAAGGGSVFWFEIPVTAPGGSRSFAG